MNYGCIGEKLGHSFSKEIHSKLFDYEYDLLELERDGLKNFFEQKNFKAINVTIPYKQAVMPYLDQISDNAKKIGAVNTIVNRGGKLYGYNTDFSGMTALVKYNGIEVKGKKVLILGSGGTSKTANEVMKSLGASKVIRVSRTAQEDCIDYSQAYKIHSDADIIVNTTPCGMYPDIFKAPIDICRFKNLSAVVDAVYNPLCSRLVLDAESRGIKSTGGLYMLVAQAVRAAELFLDKCVPNEKTDEVYRSILKQKQNIVLVGMPGSGKSTVGKILSKQMNMPFYDSDTEIEKRENKSIPEIFKTFGEAEFRKIEGEIIKQLSVKNHCIISTGGGTVLCRENVVNLKCNGRIYFLDRPLKDIVPTESRPLSSNFNELKKRYDERYDIYVSSSHEHINASGSLEENARYIKEDFENENTCD